MKLLALALITFCGLPLRAQSEIPEIVIKGLAAYQEGGAGQAVAVWLKGSESDAAKRQTFKTGLEDMEAEYGKMIGYEPILVVDITPSVRLVYVMVKLERAPAYYEFSCYRPNKDWIVSGANINAKPPAILPARIFGGER